MVGSVKIEGADSFDRLARALRTVEAGKELRKALLSNLRAAAQPVADDMRDQLRAALPQRGGVAKLLTKKKRTIAVRNRLGGEEAGMRLISTEAHDYSALERRGVLRHPKWPGNRPRRSWRWQPQEVPSARGALADALARGESSLLDAVADAVTETAEAIEAEIAREV